MEQSQAVLKLSRLDGTSLRRDVLSILMHKRECCQANVSRHTRRGVVVCGESLGKGYRSSVRAAADDLWQALTIYWSAAGHDTARADTDAVTAAIRGLAHQLLCTLHRHDGQFDIDNKSFPSQHAYVSGVLENRLEDHGLWQKKGYGEAGGKATENLHMPDKTPCYDNDPSQDAVRNENSGDTSSEISPFSRAETSTLSISQASATDRCEAAVSSIESDEGLSYLPSDGDNNFVGTSHVVELPATPRQPGTPFSQSSRDSIFTPEPSSLFDDDDGVNLQKESPFSDLDYTPTKSSGLLFLDESPLAAKTLRSPEIKNAVDDESVDDEIPLFNQCSSENESYQTVVENKAIFSLPLRGKVDESQTLKETNDNTSSLPAESKEAQHQDGVEDFITAEATETSGQGHSKGKTSPGIFPARPVLRRRVTEVHLQTQETVEKTPFLTPNPKMRKLLDLAESHSGASLAQQPQAMEFRAWMTKLQRRDPVRRVIRRMRQPLAPKSLSAGAIYCYSDKSAPGYLKIGCKSLETKQTQTSVWTENLQGPLREDELTVDELEKVRQRIQDKTKECGCSSRWTLEHHMRMPYALVTMESLIHQTFHRHAQDVVQCHSPICSERHQEWFKIDLDKAKQVISQWQEFSRCNPYSDDGLLKAFWAGWTRNQQLVLFDKKLTSEENVETWVEYVLLGAVSTFVEQVKRENQALLEKQKNFFNFGTTQEIKFMQLSRRVNTLR